MRLGKNGRSWEVAVSRGWTECILHCRQGKEPLLQLRPLQKVSMTTQKTWNLVALCQRLHPATQGKHPLPVKDLEILLFTLTRYAEIHLTPPSHNWKWGMQRILPWPASLVPLFQALVTMIETVEGKCWVGWRVILKQPLQIKARECWNIYHIAATNVTKHHVPREHALVSFTVSLQESAELPTFNFDLRFNYM